MHRHLALGLTLCLALLIPVASRADVAETLRDHILPGYQGFADATAALDQAAQGTCDVEALKAPYQLAFDAWMAVAHLRLGPVEEDGRSLAIAFWPDPKGLGWKAQKALLTGDPAALDPASFAQQSVAARGLFGLERLLYPEAALPADPCRLIRATTADLARMASDTLTGWEDGYAKVLLTAGEPGNTTFLSRPEVRQALFTQLYTGLEFLDDSRLGRPLGEPTQPHPEKAEARASGRSLRNVLLALQALRQMVETLTPDAPRTMAAFDHAIQLANDVQDPIFAGVADPQGRLKVEILQQSVTHLREVVLEEVAPELDVGIGFNAADGD